ncbi:MAG: phenylalanine--tRNA ligase subunit beta [Kiritimatiellae bacterium]|nr:phenylalanine--tRNA ligase subunit beta [Kiritimatiellia bacterium]
MKVPLSWLKEFIAIDASASEIADALTRSGTEVEDIAHVGGGLGDIVVGEIVTVDSHPNADRLRLCTVNDGTQTVNVVCGASNFSAGDKAAFAPVGSVLPDGMKIKRAKIRGEVSLGMLCAEDELGLSEGHEGIMLMSPDVAAGTPLTELLPPEDTVLTLEITWNRSDLLSIIGIARELSAVLEIPYQVPEPTFVESDIDVADMAQVTVQDDAACSRYTARVLQGLTDGDSPDWMQRRLTLCGIRPISLLVDVTNYVLLECGQPLHAFDYDKIADTRIDVRCATEGERMSTLDGVERSLTASMTLITDGSGPVALAGVMGGAGSEVGEGTTNLLLESATFDPPSIRSTSSALKLNSESSHRFERDVDQTLADWGSRRATMLFLQLAGGSVCKGMIDVRPRQASPWDVALRFDRARKLIGMPIENDVMIGILQRLQLEVVSHDDSGCIVRVPTFRGDVTIEADLIEEIARINGLDELPDVLPSAVLSPHADDHVVRAGMRLREVLVGLGLTEIINYSFLSDRFLDRFDTDDARRLRLPNPVSGDFATMRPSLIPQMVDTLGRNLSYQNDDAALCEIGTVFHRLADGGQGEARNLCVGLMGQAGRSGHMNRASVSPEEMMAWVRGVLEATTSRLHAGAVVCEPCSAPEFEPGTCMAVQVSGRPCGRIGLLAKRISDKWRATGYWGILELEVEPLLSGLYQVPQAKPVPMYPAIRRDLALVVAETVTHENVTQIIRSAAPPELTNVDLFDIFRSSGVGDGRKSLAYSLTYRSSERTLTDDEASGFDSVIVAALSEGLGAEIREN